MKTLSKTLLSFAFTIMLALGTGFAYAGDSVDIQASNNPDIEGTSTLYRHAYGIGMTAYAEGLRGGDGLPGGHPYTVWAVIFNLPEECLDSPCGPADFQCEGEPCEEGEDPPAKPRVTQGSRNYSDAYGHGYFSGFVPMGNALMYPTTAEIHFIYRRHPDRNPEYVSLNMVLGNCQWVNGEVIDGPRHNQCEDEGFSIHLPPAP